MAARTVVSYDDITLPYDQEETSLPLPPPPSKSNGQPPSKKRKKNNNQKGKHWDDPTSKSASNSQRAENKKQPKKSNWDFSSTNFVEGEGEDGAVEGGADEGECEEEEEESRELTHEEIWDDSALVYAWESAMEEYKAYHGGDDAWKKEPVKKSPLWYNVPIDTSKKPTKTSDITPAVIVASVDASTMKDDSEEDSKPLNFDTFVPSHDPSLETPQVDVAENYVPETPAGAMVSQDEAFSRALNAMYWSGYWTAMYHAQRQTPQSGISSAPTAPAPIPIENDEGIMEAEGEADDDEDDNEDIEVDDNGDFVSTQR
ncbi:hypothetical protein BDN70DRAFT_875174 [Pholiota conissans]|uniref:Survival Motor Neuron Gemin2-binding domain-containing protein n=1 Tax=Pholiota conissans TaxID=109636 RepID=A0A9P5Z6N4_9AGAR|nr:hypothetical protein BDN70DRAFT_875174 [Pholiota conissans]